MDDRRSSEDPVAERMLDGNALAGRLTALFGVDVTAVPGRCAHCSAVNPIGGLRAYLDAPGAVLRCPVCVNVVLRLVETEDAILVDARGAASLRFERRSAIR